jgi:hypothetical protein
MAVFEESFELVLRALLGLDVRARDEPGFRVLAPDDRDDELRLRDDADEVRRLDALVRRLDALPLLAALPLFDALPLLDLLPLFVVCLLLVERVPDWAIAPP